MKESKLIVLLVVLLCSVVVSAKDDIAVFRDTWNGIPAVGQWYVSYTGPNTDPNSGLSNTIDTEVLLGKYLDTPLVGDIDGDSVDDIVVVSEKQWGDPNDGSVWTACLTKRDINGDGQLGLKNVGSIFLTRFFGDKSWYYDPEDPSYDPEGRPAYSLLADVNGDGYDDAIRVETGKAYNLNWRAIHSSETTIGGLGGTYGSSSIVWGNATLGDIPVTGDFNGDGYVDAAVVRSDYSWHIALSDANGLNTAVTHSSTNPFGGTGDIPVIGDINGDGRDDAVIFRPSYGTWYGTYAAPDGTIDGGSYDTLSDPSPLVYGDPPIHYLAGVGGGNVPVLADMNDDGIDDIGVFHLSTGAWYFLLDDGVTGIGDGTVIETYFGASVDIPLIGEFNGLPGKPADIDGSGTVDLFDLADLAAYWLDDVDL